MTKANAQENHSAIDAAHLERMVFGDRDLASELLTLFLRQADMLLERMHEEPARRAQSAHVINGSARGIGAWRVAEAARQIEELPEPLEAAMAELSAAIDDVRAAVAVVLKAAA